MRRFGGRLVVGVLALVTLVAVGAYTYNLGVARGLMETGRAVESTGAGAGRVRRVAPPRAREPGAGLR